MGNKMKVFVNVSRQMKANVMKSNLLSSSTRQETIRSWPRKIFSLKKPCLDQIVDSLNEKAQAEQDTNDKHLHSNPDN